MQFFQRHITALCLTTLAAAAPAHASDALAKKNGCLGCHAVSSQLVGPSYQAVAAKYGNDKATVAMLAALGLPTIDALDTSIAPPVPWKEAGRVLKWVVAQMEDRYRRRALLSVRDLKHFNAKIRDAGSEAVGNTPAQFAGVLRADMARWAQAVRLAGLKLD